MTRQTHKFSHTYLSSQTAKPPKGNELNLMSEAWPSPMSGKNRRFIADELVEFEKKPVEVQVESYRSF